MFQSALRSCDRSDAAHTLDSAAVKAFQSALRSCDRSDLYAHALLEHRHGFNPRSGRVTGATVLMRDQRTARSVSIRAPVV